MKPIFFPFAASQACYSRRNLEERLRRKQIKTQLKECTYEQLYTLATYHLPKEDELHKFSILNSFKTIFSLRDFGREIVREEKAELATEVIAEKYPNRKQPTQLEDYL
ncbi:hypothetical protein FP803_02590 [Candidatus Woesearchaeota archaeon]|nr:hypothetical protein [Candidatus Woesearchaeota archaeon]